MKEMCMKKLKIKIKNRKKGKKEEIKTKKTTNF